MPHQNGLLVLSLCVRAYERHVWNTKGFLAARRLRAVCLWKSISNKTHEKKRNTLTFNIFLPFFEISNIFGAYYFDFIITFVFLFFKQYFRLF